MLLELSIRNFAIIDDLRISFSTGLTVLSGETGAGKSIIVQAVALTKVLNLTSNTASLALVLAGGHVGWLAGGLMVAGQLAGSWLGSHMAMRSGARLIRPLMVAVCIAMALRLLYERLG